MVNLRWGYANTNGAFFQIRLRQNTVTDNPNGNEDRILAYEKHLRVEDGWVVYGNRTASVISNEGFAKQQEVLAVLHDIRDIYLAYYKHNQKPPQAFADIHGYAKEHAKGYQAIEQGRWMVLWGTERPENDNEAFDKIVAFEKRAAETAGWILTADGSGVFVTDTGFQEYTGVIPLSHAIWHLYAEHVKDRKVPAQRLSDLEPYKTTYWKAFQAIERGDWQVQWGTEIRGEQQPQQRHVLAYQRDVLTTMKFRGAVVIMTDNLSQRMNSFEFQKAQKQ